ncbi:MAG TPA: rhomboid family intramembrane serine protease [bacterium]|nr:rhomboid family intramembrane serine protease [bacterium]
MPKLTSNTVKYLLGANVAMFLLVLMVPFILGQGDLFTFLLLGGENTELVFSGQVWRMITAAFLHANLIHIGANMYYFVQIGELIHRFFGERKLLVTYVLSAIGGSVFSILSVIMGIRPDIVSVGASGAVFGMLGMIITASWKSQRSTYHLSLPIDYRQLLPYILFSLFIGLALPGINNAAHIGGLVAGGILGLLLRPDYGTASSESDVLTDGLFYLSLGILAFGFVGLVIFNFNTFF